MLHERQKRVESRYWILVGEEIFSASQEEWAEFFDKEERFLWQHDIGEHSHVSTVFLGIDHQWGSGPPLLFETLVTDGPLADEMHRYSTYEQARLGHITMLTRCIEAERNDQSQS